VAQKTDHRLAHAADARDRVYNRETFSLSSFLLLLSFFLSFFSSFLLFFFFGFRLLRHLFPRCRMAASAPLPAAELRIRLEQVHDGGECEGECDGEGDG